MTEEQVPRGHLEIMSCTNDQGIILVSQYLLLLKALEINPNFLTLISTHQFTAMEHEDPYSHLDTFYELVGTMGFQSADIEIVYMRLFPFSLAGNAKDWLRSLPNQSLTSWKDV